MTVPGTDDDTEPAAAAADSDTSSATDISSAVALATVSAAGLVELLLLLANSLLGSDLVPRVKLTDNWLSESLTLLVLSFDVSTCSVCGCWADDGLVVTAR